MGPIFNEKVAKKWNLWVHEQYTMHCLRQKSQHLRLLFIEQYMNSNRVLPKRVKKKKNADEWNAVSKLTLIQTQFKIFFYIDDSPSNHTWKKKLKVINVKKHCIYI